MRVQPHPHKYPEVEVPSFLIEEFKSISCAECDSNQDGCGEITFHDCFRDFISSNVGFYLEASKDKIIPEEWATFLRDWYEFDKTVGGAFKSNWFDLTIDDVIYRILWFGWTEDLNASSGGYMLCYEVRG